jgi:hypothetical protein
LSLEIIVVATGFASTGLIWLGWKLSKNSHANDCSRLAVDEALNDGCVRVISGCFELEHKLEAKEDSGIQIIAGYSKDEQKVEGLNDKSMLTVVGYRTKTPEDM